MMIRGMLFLLFLYTLLVWIVAFYLGGEILQRGLFWTGVGVAALLVWLVLERIIAWQQARKARSAGKPAVVAASAPAKNLSPESTAIRALIEEANGQLAQAPSLKGSASSIFDLPLYLIVGAEGAGKTTVIQHSGMEPFLLAGQTSPSGQDAPSTRVANIWLAKGATYLEIGGRVFSGDSAKFAEWLEQLAPKPKVSPALAFFAKTKMASWFTPPARPRNLRGVLVLSDMREFLKNSDMSKLDRFAALVRERLDAIGAHFGIACPAYLLFTRTDQVPYFREFFARLTENDSGQLFGAMTAAESKLAAGEVWAEAETRRLNSHFNQLFLRLSDRRLQALTTEPEMQTRPAVYEFPREFKRSRTPLIQFLVDIFRPNPLKQGPQLRGFFFTGQRMVERSQNAPGGETRILRGGNIDSNATTIFRPEMTTVFSAANLGKSSGPQVAAWAFLTDLFNCVIPGDRPQVASLAPAAVAPWKRKPVLITAAIAAVLLAGFTTSWLRNWSLISRTRQQVEAMAGQSGLLSVPNLQSLDDLRGNLETLEEGRPWSMRWGLYSGDQVLQSGQEAYFKRMKALFLAGANGALGASLAQGPAVQAPLYDQLKTYVTITQKACPVDTSQVNSVLNQAVATWKPNLDPQISVLVDRQLKYYARILDFRPTPPVALAQDQKAVGTARATLIAANGFEPQLNALMAQVAKQVPKLRVADRIPEYTKVLAGPDEMPPQFTKAGATLTDSLIESGDWGGGGEECVTGQKSNIVAGAMRSSESKKQLRDLYYLRYAQAWRTFLHSYRVLPYASRQDAAAKLDILSSSQSPLLLVVKLVAENTNFPQKANEPSYFETTAQKVGLGDIVDKYKKGQQKAADAQKEVQQLVQGPPGLTANDVTKLMQPVHVTTPPTMPVLVNDANTAYIMGLRGLQQSLDAISRGSEADVLPLIPQAQQALTQARNGLRSLSDKFADTGNQGLNGELTSLLEQPIKNADNMLPKNTGAFTAGKQNGELAAVCKEIGSVLSKYPFTALSSVDTSLAEIKRVFGPGTGLVWQFQQKTLPEIVAKEGSNWVQVKPMPRVTSSLLAFLSRSQQLTDVFFAGGNPNAPPTVTYALRRVTEKPPISLKIDGKEMNTATSGLRVEFTWPGGAQQGAEGYEGDASFNSGFGKYPGLWGVFRLFQYADNRPLGEKSVQWSQMRGPGVATPQAITPPAKLEFVQFPNGVDLFNPAFFTGLKCPTQAVIAE